MDDITVKYFDSTDPEVLALIKNSISEWPYGYCKLYNPEDIDTWAIDIEPQKNLESTKVVIDAFIHAQCERSMFGMDLVDMYHWFESGNEFAKLSTQAPNKTLPYEFHVILTQFKSQLENKEIKCVVLTLLGKHMSLSECEIYLLLLSNLKCRVIVNTLFIDDYPNDTQVILHIALDEKKSDVQSELPAFLGD